MTTRSPTDSASAIEPGQSRYVIFVSSDKRCVRCVDAPNLTLEVARNLTVGEADRKRLAAQSIFVDGVYDGPPFYDNEKRHYSLDHHSGCVRAFTLAPCEQAVVLLLQGIPLTEGNWTIYVNNPDLDAVLATWLLLNHGELLRDGMSLLRSVMPLVRVEGVIDAHGLEMGILTALSDADYEDAKGKLEHLLEQETLLKAKGDWLTTDVVEYTAGLLEKIDQLVFPSARLDSMLAVHESRRVALTTGKLAVMCRSRASIYAVEAQLRRRYPRRLGVIVLDRGGGQFTLRQADPFMQGNLRQAYEALNRREMDSRKGDLGDDQGWGGSDAVGGSPRPSGTTLSAEEVLLTIQRAYRSGGWFTRLADRIRRMGPRSG